MEETEGLERAHHLEVFMRQGPEGHVVSDVKDEAPFLFRVGKGLNKLFRRNKKLSKLKEIDMERRNDTDKVK